MSKNPRKQKSPPPEDQQRLADQAENDAQRGLAEALTRARKARFLKEFKHHKIVAIAARRVGIDRRTVYKWTAADPAFKDDLVNLQEEITDQLEKELLKLATGAYSRPLVSAGKLVAYEEIHSESALLALLRAYRPKLYRERSTLEVSGSVDSRVEITKKEVTVTLVADVTRLLAEQGLATDDHASLADIAGAEGQSVDSALALAKASRVPKPPA